MKKVLFTLLLVAVAWCAGTAIASAQAPGPATQNVTVTANVGAHLRLQMDFTTITFNDADPTATPSVPAVNPIAITATARVGATSTVSLTCLANTDLSDGGGNTIAISNITWTATGAGYVPGTMSSASAVNVGGWTGPGARGGTNTFSFANSWTYVPGTYTATVVYTLSAT